MFLGLSAGGIIAAGVFAFLAIIGVFPRLIGKTRTNRHIFLYETVIIIGGVLGNVSDLYEFPLLMGGKYGAGDIRSGGGNLRWLSRHVPGGDTESAAGYQPADSSGRRSAVLNPVYWPWEADRLPRVFFRKFWKIR